MYRNAKILMDKVPAGILSENEEGYSFNYFEEYLKRKNSLAVSLTLPLNKNIYKSSTMFPFFDGLIPEGWLLDIAQKTWKIDIRDRMGLLLACCKDCVGAVSVVPFDIE